MMHLCTGICANGLYIDDKGSPCLFQAINVVHFLSLIFLSIRCFWLGFAYIFDFLYRGAQMSVSNLLLCI